MIELRNSCILPSNAPTLPGNGIQDFNTPFHDRVLQEGSGNGQHDFLGFPTEVERKPRPAALTAHRFPKFRSDYAGHYDALNRPQDDRTPAEIEEEFRQLWAYLHEAEEAEPWRDYRARQPSAAAKGKCEKQVWPDHLEMLFFRALVQWRPMGRTKKNINGVLKGRNELISLFIWEHSGEERERKKISSHSQNLRPFFAFCPMVLRLMPAEKKTDKKGKGRNTRVTDESCQPIGFVIRLYPGRNDKGDLLQPEHTYTELVTERHSDADNSVNLLNKRSVEAYSRRYPQLDQMYREDLLDCEVILFDASIELTPDHLRTPSELGIDLHFSRPRAWDIGRYEHFESRIHFYEDGEHCDSSSKAFPCAPDAMELNSVPFGSYFWMRKISHLSKQLYDAQNIVRGALFDDACSPQKRAMLIEQRVRDTVKRLSVVHEIYGVPHGSPNGDARHSTDGEDVKTEPERLLCSFWRFHLTEGHAKGRTMWRRLEVTPVKGEKVTRPPPTRTPQLPLPKAEDFDPLSFAFPDVGAYPVPQEFDSQVFDQHAFDHPSFDHPSFDHQSFDQQAFDLDSLSAYALLAETSQNVDLHHSANEPAAYALSAEPSQDVDYHHHQIDEPPGYALSAEPSQDVDMNHQQSSEPSPSIELHGQDSMSGHGPFQHENAMDFTSGHIAIRLEPGVSFESIGVNHNDGSHGHPHYDPTYDHDSASQDPCMRHPSATTTDCCYPDLPTTASQLSPPPPSPSGLDARHMDDEPQFSQQAWCAYAGVYEPDPFQDHQAFAEGADLDAATQVQGFAPPSPHTPLQQQQQHHHDEEGIKEEDLSEMGFLREALRGGNACMDRRFG